MRTINLGILTITFADGYERLESRVMDYEVFDCRGLYCQRAGEIGFHLAYFENKIPWLRRSEIWIVRQRCFYRTLIVILHELAHAAIWLCYLPQGLGDRLHGLVHQYIYFGNPDIDAQSSGTTGKGIKPGGNARISTQEVQDGSE